MRAILLKILTAFCVTCAVSGTGVLIGVWAVPQWEAYQAEMQVSEMQASSSTASASEVGSHQLSEAHNYNEALAGSSSSSSSTPYREQLTAVDATAISWLHIPSINVRRPIYHYDNEEVLMNGLGHIKGTSLPVGGESTHCCVTGHSGMLGSRMFDDLNKMKVGDVFVFWTLGDPYAYKVYDVEIVEPNDTSSLYIQQGRDLATLVTCTPIGINSHRLLVHGERTDYVPEEIANAEQHPTSDRLWVMGIGVAAAAALAGMGLYALLGGAAVKAGATAAAASSAGAGSSTGAGITPGGTGTNINSALSDTNSQDLIPDDPDQDDDSEEASGEG